MSDIIKPLLGAAVGLQAVSLLAHNLSYLDRPRGKKKRKKKLLGLGVTNLIAIPIIAAQASMVNEL